jgi:hypothetical protein
MPDSIKLWTQQGDDWDLTDAKRRIDVTRSEYAKTHPHYVERVGRLARLVGTDQFVWCIDESSEFAFARPEPKYEWLIEIERGRILGYVQDDPWSQYIDGADLQIEEIFSTSRPSETGVSYLVKFPLLDAELIRPAWDLKDGRRPRGWRPSPSR